MSDEFKVSDPIVQAMLDKLMARKGQIVTMKTKRVVKVCQAAKGNGTYEKESEFQCRVGVNYDNIKAVIEKRENGDLPAKNAGLPWGTWVVFPYVIEHKGEYYIRCSTINTTFRREPVYTLNGAKIDVEDVKRVALASEFRDSDEGRDVFNIKISSLIEVK